MCLIPGVKEPSRGSRVIMPVQHKMVLNTLFSGLPFNLPIRNASSINPGIRGYLTDGVKCKTIQSFSQLVTHLHCWSLTSRVCFRPDKILK